MAVFSFQSSALSDVGLVRALNEDAILRLPDSGVFCVADGVGGGDAGEVASAFAVKYVREAVEALGLPRELAPSLDELRDCCVGGLWRANQAIRDYSDEHDLSSCASTGIVLAVTPAEPHMALCLHIGDSRLYRLRAGELEPLTSDHSFEAGDGGHDVSTLPPMFKHMITRALGLKSEPDLEESRHDVAEGDVLLLCSDGLSNYVSEDLIKLIMLESTTMEEVSSQLVAAANHGGGRDNISVILVQVSD